MCGRYASTRDRAELMDLFAVERDATAEELKPDYNVAPTKEVYAVLTSTPRGERKRAGEAGEAGAATPEEPEEPQEPVRELRELRWGLIPFWAKDLSIGSRMINARAETVSEKPAFRRAFARRRCLLPADGYYEWYAPDAAEVADAPAAAGQERPGGKKPKKPPKQPYYIHPADGGVLALAGLYELWKDPELPDDHPRKWLWTCTVITTSATDELGRIHDRMPMFVEGDKWDAWLDPTLTDPELVRPLLVPAGQRGLTAYAVSTAVNNVRNNSRELLEPLPNPGDSGEDSGTLF
ncbi:MAG: SOS response-associated peptidase [Streptosporangiales bacterium]|nr:SOS response-associated peptidase [Streptosporangiales bacterium]